MMALTDEQRRVVTAIKAAIVRIVIAGSKLNGSPSRL